MKQTIILLVFALSITTICEAYSFFVSTDVKIINALGPQTDLNVHCRSKNDDIGLHNLHHEDNFQFHFRPNYWRSTKFYCSFKWSDQFHWFDIFIHNRDDCKHCTWMIKSGGPCRYNDETESFDKCYLWNDKGDSN
ncbi:hypothetical protein PRUPE_1G062900 [Prunus persica]|uniref:S-protein homolog n=1 Tax=Prunus persica TaxID=3760 RepID=M5Y2W6_PRUPE|nr:hypothetical protein PRUPE_1G062900 [Prunus persica]